MPAEKEMPTSVSPTLMQRVSNLPDVPSAAALMAMANEPGTVRDFALYVAALPCHRDIRNSGDYMDSKILRPQPINKWLPCFQTNLWAHHKWVVHACHSSGREVADVQLDCKTTKKQAPELAGTRLVTWKKVPTADEARKAEAATREECCPHPCVLWLDNHNKQRYSKNPGDVPSNANRRTAEAGNTNECIIMHHHGSVMAIVPCPGVP